MFNKNDFCFEKETLETKSSIETTYRVLLNNPTCDVDHCIGGISTEVTKHFDKSNPAQYVTIGHIDAPYLTRLVIRNVFDMELNTFDFIEYINKWLKGEVSYDTE